MSNDKKLTLKQYKFVSSYIKDGNATKAAIEAYPDTSYGTQRAIASENLSKPNIQQKIRVILDEQGLTPDLIIKELKGLIVDNDDKSEKNKAIRTAAEIMGLTGAKSNIFTNVNIENRPIFVEMMDFLKNREMES